MSDAHDSFRHPLTTRYASAEMRRLFSERHRFGLWRRLWLALAETQAELGLKIREDQLAELRAHLDDVDFAAAERYEKELRHDVMAHVHALGDQAPLARPIVHLGATSCFVTDNADLVILREALCLLQGQLATLIESLAHFARAHAALPALGFTHFQAAQPVTVGKRATLWLQDLLMDWDELARLIDEVPLRGAKGTTGTQASFLELFGGDHEKVRELDRRIAQKMGFARTFAVTGQTYPRKFDYRVLAVLSGLGQSASKFAVDLRLLAHRKEMEEPFESKQIGSSAMAYKRNPMRSERMTSLARYLLSLPENAAHTAANQWLERTLDDSANRRIVLAEGFLAADAILSLYRNVASGLVVYDQVIARHLAAELPFMVTEKILMAAVERGGDRQTLHEVIRAHSQAAAAEVKLHGRANDLIERLRADPEIERFDLPWETLLDAHTLTGRAHEQTLEFLAEEVEPRLLAYAGPRVRGDEVRV
ncbi:MAG: adenylosuccinate lyase [Planctomycetes bacterium]|nr:adenylosuccinate lyase [Planctomycetota bacterium]